MSTPQEEEVFVLASTYLDDALHCRNISFVPEREETRSYRLYKSRPLTALVYAAVVVICLLALFERPALDRYICTWFTDCMPLHSVYKRRVVRSPAFLNFCLCAQGGTM